MTCKIKIRPKALKFNEYRLRVGNYRIIYELNQNELVVIVTKADNRGQIYKQF